MKQLHGLIFQKEKKPTNKGIFMPTETTLKSNNYAMLHNIAPFFPSQNCPLCKTSTDKQDHLIFQCHITQPSRIMITDWLKNFGISFNYRSIIEMHNIQDTFTNPNN